MGKIIICGLNGSGKTTLGKELSKEISKENEYLHKDIEEYYFSKKNNYDTSKTREEVTLELERDFNKYKNIILTACKGDYGSLSDLYDFAIFIKLDKETRLKRVKERSYKQFGDRILENGDLYEREKSFFDMVYNREEATVINWFRKLKCPKIEIDGERNVSENVDFVLKELEKYISI